MAKSVGDPLEISSSHTAHDTPTPSAVEVARPSSSTRTRLCASAALKMKAVSCNKAHFPTGAMVCACAVAWVWVYGFRGFVLRRIHRSRYFFVFLLPAPSPPSTPSTPRHKRIPTQYARLAHAGQGLPASRP